MTTLQTEAEINNIDTIDVIEKILPQTQCGQCGFGGCRPYATALVRIENTAINLCPPGGKEVILQLHQILKLKLELNPSKQISQISENDLIPPPFNGFQTVSINENQCIGCTLCLDVCPTDAIIGSPKHLHRVIEDDCTGCGLCIPACPVDCITWNENKNDQNIWDKNKKNKAYHNHQERKKRLQTLQNLSGLNQTDIQFDEALQGISERIPTTLFDAQKIKKLDKKNILASLKKS